MRMEIQHNIKQHEKTLLDSFNCIYPKKEEITEDKEIRRAPESTTATPWSLPTLLPLPTLPTLPPPEKVFNDLANFFFPRVKVNMSGYTSTASTVQVVGENTVIFDSFEIQGFR